MRSHDLKHRINSDLLDRIEIVLERIISGLQETKARLEETRAIASKNLFNRAIAPDIIF
jgi:hypothetical protein